MQTARQMLLGLLLTALASSILLLSDMDRRKAAVLPAPRLALLQYASQPAIDESVRGMIDGLAEAGFIDGKSIAIQQYKAEGDIPTLNMIASEIAGGAFDLIVTSTTPALQAVANANKESRLPHVFGLVGDPAGSGVGISREDPLDHPGHLVGLGTMMPVEETFGLARELLPSLRRVGVVWNAAEVSSEVNTAVARELCQELDIELLEANVSNSSEVFEAAGSLASRGAQAIWVGADIVVLGALESLVKVASEAKIPVFTSISGSVKRGTLFDLGPDYHEIGRLTGALAGKVLGGTNPAAIPIRNTSTSKLLVNKMALAGLRDAWKLPDDVLQRADVVIDEKGLHEKNPPRAVTSITKDSARGPLSKTWKVNLLKYVEIEDSEEAERGSARGSGGSRTGQRTRLSGEGLQRQWRHGHGYRAGGCLRDRRRRPVDHPLHANASSGPESRSRDAYCLHVCRGRSCGGSRTERRGSSAQRDWRVHAWGLR